MPLDLSQMLPFSTGQFLCALLSIIYSTASFWPSYGHYLVHIVLTSSVLMPETDTMLCSGFCAVSVTNLSHFFCAFGLSRFLFFFSSFLPSHLRFFFLPFPLPFPLWPPHSSFGARPGTLSRPLPPGVQEGVKVTLDCAQATFISYDKMVISLKGGEM